MVSDENSMSKNETPQEENFASRTTITGLHPNDGSMNLNIDGKNLNVHADFIPPLGEGQPLSPDFIASALDRLNISNGIDWDAIRDAVMECNLNRQIVRDVLIARGTPPVEEVLEYYELDPSFRTWQSMPDGDVPRIDYREISPFVVVKKEQVLAKFNPRKTGEPGLDIYGKEIPKPVRKPDSIEAGENTKRRTEGIVAAKDGRLVEQNGVISVEEVLAVKGSVGYKTGHIVFPGDVIIDGIIADGFKVYSGGSIISKQTFDASDVIAKKDFLIAGGLIGRGKASVKAGGDFRAKFIQNCRVAVRGSVIVGAAVINSTIYTLNTLDLGDKGRLIGSEVYAVNGVRTAGIGTSEGKSTKLHCGIDFTAQQELDRTNEQLRILGLKATKLRELIADPATELIKKQKAEQLYLRIQQEQGRLSEKLTELLGKINANENAEVLVFGEISKNTLIEICHVALFLDKNMKKVRFRLDKTQGKLVSEPLK